MTGVSNHCLSWILDATICENYSDVVQDSQSSCNYTIIRIKAIISIEWWYRHSHTYAYNLQSYCTWHDIFALLGATGVLGIFCKCFVWCEIRRIWHSPFVLINPWGFPSCKKQVICMKVLILLKKMVQALETCISFKTIFVVGIVRTPFW